MPFGQLVVGPPGSGKTTYCTGMKEFLTGIGRDVVIMNLDPANDNLPYECAIDINDLINMESVQDEYKLGPNGALVYCMEYLETNFDWIQQELAKHADKYVLIDCPGQVELWTHHKSIHNIIHKLTNTNYRMTVVHLVDAHYASDPSKYIAVLLLSLSTMLQLELPQINVLSKIDLIEQYGRLAFNLEYYTEVQDLKYLLPHLDQDEFGARFRKLNEAICDVVEDFSLVCFTTLNIQDKESVYEVVKLVDKAGGYVFGALENNDTIFGVAHQQPNLSAYHAEQQEKYMAPWEADDDDDEYDEDLNDRSAEPGSKTTET
eukprot:GFYU01012148.1.p1 GENE.GFYU01012148.1~~GFYU01012148.1.p1  ORF type:complete len:318 (-),score=92.21 GFYU01012148.1:170-1123(-)